MFSKSVITSLFLFNVGSSFSPNETAINGSRRCAILQLHKRYVDDIVGAASCQRDELENFIDYVFNIHPALQFTSTITEMELSFLDITLRISEDRIQTSIFYKETDTHNYLHLSSFHPAHCKCAIPYSQFLRLRRLCSDDDDFVIKSREMMTFFTQRGYPLTSLDQDLRSVTTIGRPDALTGSERGDTSVGRVPLVMTYPPVWHLHRTISTSELSHSIQRPANARHLSTATYCSI